MRLENSKRVEGNYRVHLNERNIQKPYFKRFILVTNVVKLQNNNLVVIKTYVYFYNFCYLMYKPHSFWCLRWIPRSDDWARNSAVCWCSQPGLWNFFWGNKTVAAAEWLKQVGSTRKVALQHLWMVPPVYKHCLHTIWLQTEEKAELVFFFVLYLHQSCSNDKPIARKEGKLELRLGY